MKLLFFIFSLLLSVATSNAQQLEVQISGSADFGNSFLSITEAGMDFPEVVEASSEFYISVIDNDNLGKKTNPNTKWTINIYKQDTWSSSPLLEAMRTGNGARLGNSGRPNISGGEVFQTITNTSGYFCNGSGEVVDIPVKLRLSGLSVTMGAGAHNSDIIFTIYDNW